MGWPVGWAAASGAESPLAMASAPRLQVSSPEEVRGGEGRTSEGQVPPALKYPSSEASFCAPAKDASGMPGAGKPVEFKREPFDHGCD